jgi:hypothetical protein
MNRDLPYEDDNFIEKQMLPAASRGGPSDACVFIIQHKGSENIFEVTARDRDELAAKIAAGQYEDVDPRNDRSPADLDADATDE